MRKLYFAVLLVISLMNSAYADGPVEFEGTKPVDEDNAHLHKRQREGGSFTKKPEVVLSTVGPVPVNTQAAVAPGNGVGINPQDLNIVVAPPVRGGGNGGGQGNVNGR
jgi:hypothetical protein